MVSRVLKKLQEEFPHLVIEEVEVTTNPLVSLRQGVKMIPTLMTGDKKLTGIILSEEKIRDFIIKSGYSR